MGCPGDGTSRLLLRNEHLTHRTRLVGAIPQIPRQFPRPSAPLRTPRCPRPSHHRVQPLRRCAGPSPMPPAGSLRHTLSTRAWKRRSGSSFAFACSTVWSFRTLADPVRLAPVVMSLPPFRTAPNSGPFPRRALPRVPGTTGPSATLPARPAPRGFRLPRARHRRGFPCCYAFHLPHVPTPLPRRKPAVLSLLSPPVSSSLGRLRRFRLRARLGYRISCEALLPKVLQPMSLPP